MSETALSLTCRLITPEKPLFEGPVSFVAVPAYDGEVGIMRGHAALVARLGEGPLRIHAEGGKRFYYIAGGFAEVSKGRVTVLASEAEPVENPAVADADRMIEDARVMPAGSAEETAAKYASLRRARGMGRIAHDAARR